MNRSKKEALGSVHYEYSYPEDLNLEPLSKEHDAMVSKVMELARMSQSVVRSRYETWEELDRITTSYVPADQAERTFTKYDPKEPRSVVVPVTSAMLDVMLTNLSNIFLSDTIFHYQPLAPEDTIPVAMLERIIDLHMHRFKVNANLRTQWRDGLIYGVGASVPTWESHITQRRRPTAVGLLANMLGESSDDSSELYELVYEGNALRNISPYNYLPDPEVSATDIQRGEFVGWIERTNLQRLLEKEVYEKDDSLFNVKYLRHVSGNSSLFEESTHETDRGIFRRDATGPNVGHPVDIVHMYVRLIPAEWDLGSSENPEKWYLAVAADSVVISAEKVDLDHGLFPVTVFAPGCDGYSMFPTSRVEMVYGLQMLIDWFMNSRIADVRKNVNGIQIFDPTAIDPAELAKSDVSKMLPLRQGALGRDIDKVYRRIDNQDVTRSNVEDMRNVMDMLHRVSGVTDPTQGIQRQSSERVTAQEFSSVFQSAMNRIEQIARIANEQHMQDLGVMFAAHTQQFMTQEEYITTFGRWQSRLQERFGQQDQLLASPLAVLGAWDVEPHPAKVPGRKNVDVLLRLWEMVSNNETLAQSFDHTRFFEAIASELGVENIDDFFIQQQAPMQQQVVPDEQAVAMAEQGDIVPMGEGGGDGRFL